MMISLLQESLCCLSYINRAHKYFKLSSPFSFVSAHILVLSNSLSFWHALTWLPPCLKLGDIVVFRSQNALIYMVAIPMNHDSTANGNGYYHHPYRRHPYANETCVGL